MDRKRQIEEVLQMRQDVILATINEKQANISLLEVFLSAVFIIELHNFYYLTLSSKPLGSRLNQEN